MTCASVTAPGAPAPAVEQEKIDIIGATMNTDNTMTISWMTHNVNRLLALKFDGMQIAALSQTNDQVKTQTVSLGSKTFVAGSSHTVCVE